MAGSIPPSPWIPCHAAALHSFNRRTVVPVETGGRPVKPLSSSDLTNTGCIPSSAESMQQLGVRTSHSLPQPRTALQQLVTRCLPHMYAHMSTRAGACRQQANSGTSIMIAAVCAVTALSIAPRSLKGTCLKPCRVACAQLSATVRRGRCSRAWSAFMTKCGLCYGMTQRNARLPRRQAQSPS